MREVQGELAFEIELVEYLGNIAGTKQWQYEKEIKTTEALWNNFKIILEQHNQNTLDHPLSAVEFAQVKKIISDLKTPYEAGQFLYGLNGVSQIEIDLDDGRHVFLTVFDQKQIGAGDTIYQVVNQINRPAVITGKQNRIFDTTLLINGLPIIQIEEKRETHDINEALNQMHQYIDENQYRDIFSTLQILVALTPTNVKYMANTTSDKFNKDFAFNWQRKEDNSIVRNWKEFADSMLSIPMAHQMATNYMILDGTKNKQMLKAMRPYQVYATQNVIDNLKNVEFDLGMNKVGYIWHTTGSGKTITSFKTAWLASRMPKVDKVVFVVDRIALTRQTNENYQAYDPDGDVGESGRTGSVEGTNSTTELSRKLKSKDNGIIVTSVQKLGTLVNRKSFQAPDKNIVFIVDEAHRSTGGDNFAAIQKAFRRSAWVGYSGTPMFDETTNGLRTEDIFGPLLHAYTIREAIADRNVLGFKVDFETTIDEKQVKAEYLPAFYRNKYPNWTEEKIQEKITNLTPEDMDDTIEPSFYDENPDHVKLVVEDIFKNWRNRSNEGKYNALFTTHVGGGKASTPMAMMYFREFQRVNEENKQNGGQILKVAITFSQNTSNSDTMLETNKGLFDAISAYNNEFGTSFDMSDVSGYTQDVTSRLNKTASDKNFLDLVIVVDQLLTGFDAPEMNTLYVDRTLKGAGLIQAYSRTNRIADMLEKPWGRVVNYRWPAYNEKLMNKALAVYANKDSAVLSDEERKLQNETDGVIAQPFEKVFNEVKEVVEKLEDLTDEFQALPPSEKKKDDMLELLKKYNSGMAKLKQYDPAEVEGEQVGFDYDNPDELVEKLGMTGEQETMLTTVLTNELKQHLAKKQNVPVYQIELRMTHVKDVKIDYDYLTELVEQLLNQVHEKKMAEAKETQEKINQFANGLEDHTYGEKIKNAAVAIVKGLYPPEGSDFKYPAKLSSSELVIQEANTVNLDFHLQGFRIKWGIIDIITSKGMRELFGRHRYGLQDLDDQGQIREIIAEASVNYKTLALDAEVKAMSKIKYRNNLRDAIYELADTLAEN
ncbi:type I restriction enzyme R subunit [Enterococcus sp. PF1-24]|uniref:type I restriction endonuclease subunit R n=1 Tax=unclassified Enterococcus TaxID=2608891 RepID=UPI002475E3C1|nr:MULTISPECIES: HsdR family type I site-specific deoxyribonuclease [unclassified Enterococcus]MDH6364056.1 type I restriction enzyme R subunit [Enterococcus sp. PFB1-1]MDH6401157.1 type I restriction enzyme R subunit [Enterococcus sp. PF1-24]